MKARLSIKTLTASLLLAFATAFTLSACSSGDDEGGGNGGNNNGGGGIPAGGGGSFSGAGAGDKAQAYTADWNWNLNNMAYTKYTGSGDIKMEVGCDEYWENCDYIPAGKIESGFVKLQLPSSIDSKYLMDIGEALHFYDLPPSCNAPADVKASMVWFYGLGLEYCEYESGERCEFVHYLYSSKAANNISCNFRDDKFGDVRLSLNLEKGWNEVYIAEKGSYYISTDKRVLDHLNDIKWLIWEDD